VKPDYDELMTCTRAKGTEHESLDYDSSSIVMTPHAVNSILSH
jgi:hypothetical protein